MQNYYKPGCWNVICTVCGSKFKSDEIKKRWDGALVCKDDWEPRHILDFIRPVTERAGVPFSNPEPTDVFVGTTCPYPTQYAMADIGTADCSRADSSGTIISTLTASGAIASLAVTGVSYAFQGITI